MDYTLTPKELTQLKAKLTKAIKGKNPEEILATVNAALAIFEEKGYPDCWSDWERAKGDAIFSLNIAHRSF